MIKVLDNSKDGIYNSNMELVDSFTDYSSKNLDFDKPVTIELMDDEENAKNPLGTTAHYNPDEMKITIYVTGRHIKDILRSISHELIHHVQNCRGDLSGMQDTSLGYAQRDKHMRDMETEAFNSGNIMNFRDFEDNYKQRNHKMSKLQENRLKKLNGLLMEQVGDLPIAEPEAVMARMKAVPERPAKPAAAAPAVSITNVRDQILAAERALKSVSSALESETSEALKKAKEAAARWDNKAISLEQIIDALLPFLMALQNEREGRIASGDVGKEPFRIINNVIRKRIAPLIAALQKSKSDVARAASRGQRAPGRAPKTWKKCDPLKKPFVRMGCGGDEVEIIQIQLHDLLGLKSDQKKFADGKFWTATKKAVKIFQKKLGLKPDGIVGPTTAKVLQREHDKLVAADATGKPVAKKALAKKVAKAAAKGAAVPPAAVALEDIPVDVELTPRQAVQTAMKMMRVMPRRPWSNESSELAGRTVLHYIRKGDSPAKAYEKALKIFGLQGRLTKLGPVSRGVWMRSFLDKLGIMSVDDLPKLPRLPTE